MLEHHFVLAVDIPDYVCELVLNIVFVFSDDGVYVVSERACGFVEQALKILTLLRLWDLALLKN